MTVRVVDREPKPTRLVVCIQCDATLEYGYGDVERRSTDSRTITDVYFVLCPCCGTGTIVGLEVWRG